MEHTSEMERIESTLRFCVGMGRTIKAHYYNHVGVAGFFSGDVILDISM